MKNKIPEHVFSVYSNAGVKYVNKENFEKHRDGFDYEFHLDPRDVPKDDEVVNIIDKGEKYLVTIRNRRTGETIQCDVYDVLEAFKITCSAMAHGLKKFLMAGKRGAKDFNKDCDEGINSVEQSKLLQKYRD